MKEGLWGIGYNRDGVDVCTFSDQCLYASNATAHRCIMKWCPIVLEKKVRDVTKKMRRGGGVLLCPKCQFLDSAGIVQG